jgi:hypothetical protein
MPPIIVPTTYYEWVKTFDMLKAKSDDEAVLLVLNQGLFLWQDGIAERFERKLLDTVNERIKVALHDFNHQFESFWGKEAQIVQALLDLRKEFKLLSQVVSIPCIPETVSAQYCEMLHKQAEAIQDAIEHSARADRTGKMTSIVCNHKTNEF